MAEFYKSAYNGIEIDEEITYVKTTARKKIEENEKQIQDLKDSVAKEKNVVKYMEKNQPSGYLGLDETGKFDGSFIEEGSISLEKLDADVQDGINNANKINSDEFANALKDTISGEVIRVDDVSPLEHMAKVKVSRKNVFDYKRAVTASNETTIDGDVITTNFKNGAVYFNIRGFTSRTVLPEGTYTATIVPVSETFRVLAIVYDTAGNTIASKILASSSGVLTFTFTANSDFVFSLAGDYGGGVLGTFSYKIQIEEGDKSTGWLPYVDDIASVKVTRYGKNPFWVDAYLENRANKDIIPATKISEDSFTLISNYNGYQYFGSPLRLFDSAKNLEGKTIMVSGTWEASNQNSGALRVQWITPDNRLVGNIIATAYTSGQVKSGTIPPMPEEGCALALFVYLNYDKTLAKGDTVTYENIQVEIGDKATEYERYTPMEEYKPEADGTIEIPSLSPTMTLLTDTEGAKIHIEYNRDANKLYNDLLTMVANPEAGGENNILSNKYIGAEFLHLNPDDFEGGSISSTTGEEEGYSSVRFRSKSYYTNTKTQYSVSKTVQNFIKFDFYNLVDGEYVFVEEITFFDSKNFTGEKILDFSAKADYFRIVVSVGGTDTVSLEEALEDILIFSKCASLETSKVIAQLQGNKNLVGNKANILYPVDLKTGCQLTFSTSDGSKLAETIKVQFHDDNKEQIDYYSFFINTSARTIALPFDVKYISLNIVPSVPIQIEIGTEKTEYFEYCYSLPKLNENVLEIAEDVNELNKTLIDSMKRELAQLTRTNYNAIGVRSDFCFPAISDIHNNANGWNRFKDYASKYGQFFDCCMCFGDNVTSPTDDTTWFDISNMAKPLLFTVGNHDVAYGNSLALSQNEIYNRYTKPLIDNGFVDNVSTPYYYKDFTDKKIRVITIMEYEASDTSTTPQWYMWQRYLTSEQLQWFADTLYNTPADYHVIVTLHSMVNSDSVEYIEHSFCISKRLARNIYAEHYINMSGDPLGDIVNAFVNSLNISKTYTNGAGELNQSTVNKDFTSRVSGNFVCFIGGHTHEPRVIKNTNYPYQLQIVLPSACSTPSRLADDIVIYDANTRDNFYVIAVDTDHRIIKLKKVGETKTIDGRTRDHDFLYY